VFIRKPKGDARNMPVRTTSAPPITSVRQPVCVRPRRP
jgi:hypothetical protein